MPCSQPHDELTVKFCPLCGENLKTEKIEKFICASGHKMKPDQKFCGTCGSEAANQKQASTPRPNPVRNSDSIINESYVPPKVNTPPPLTTEFIESAAAFQDYPVRKQFGSGSKNSIIGLVSGLFILILVILIAGNSAKAEPVTITVEMTIKDESCWDLSWGYGDIPNGQVIISVDGVSAGYGSYSSLGSSTILGCKFTAYISDVPSDGENYSISMASGRRGTVYNSRSDLIANDWTFSLSLN
jgi:hypothetical protein